ncbi:MAG: hypothetical protein ACREXY_12780 [Gammaproteobacteria bacterium]
MTRIEQLQKTGIIRTGSSKRGFRYKKADGGRVSAADLSRTGDLVIPPAWTGVAMAGFKQLATMQLAAEINYP